MSDRKCFTVDGHAVPFRDGGTVMEAALERIGGRSVLNSANLEDGEAEGSRLDRVFTLAREHGAAVICLLIDERGQARDTEWKMEVAHRIHDLATNRYGLAPEDLIFDALTFPLSTGDDDLRKDAMETMEAIRRIKAELPGVATVLGVSNVSFGLRPGARKALNSVFLHECLDAGLDAEIWGFSRAVRADVEALVELGLTASVIESPISDGKLQALGVSRDTMLERIRSAVSFATEQGIRVAFFGVDSTRADLEFVRRAYEGAVEAGAQEVAVVDTLGIATPEAAAFLVNEVVERLDYEVPVHWHGHDDFGLATAAAVAAVQAGASWVQGTVNGMGERGGNADLVEIALTLEALYGIPTRLRLERARDLSRLVQDLAGTPLAPWKAVTGDNLFTRESGAVAAQFHDPPAIEPYSSELVGARRGIVLGKKSGIDSIRIKVTELGLDVAEERYPDLLEAVKRAGTKKRGLVTDAELRRLARRHATG